jgi:two-component system sensor histidine kinase YesM
MKFAVWRKSLVARMLLTFLLSMVPIYFIGTGIYNWGIGTVRSEIINTKTKQISVYIGNLENDIQRLKILQSDCLMSKEINMLSNGSVLMDDYERIEYMLGLQQRLFTVKNSSPLAGSVTAFIPKLGRSIPYGGSIRDISTEDIRLMRLYDNSTYSQIMRVGNMLLMNQGFPTFSNPSYSITITLSTDELNRSIQQFNTYDESGTILFSSRMAFETQSGHPEGPAGKITAFVDSLDSALKNGNIWQTIDGSQYLIIFQRSSYLGVTLAHFIPQEQIFNSLWKYQFWFILFTIASIIIIGVFSFSMNSYIRNPVNKLISAFQRLENGDMDFEIKHKYDDEIGNLYQHFNVMIKKLDLTIKHEYMQEIMVRRAELKQLQSQINPHFLYNSFFILYTMTRRGEYELLEKFELQLGEYFQCLTRSSSDEIPLSQEVDHARTYCDIQALRFSNRIEILFEDLPAAYADVMVPRLIIQPIIENAFDYGLESKEESGLLRISFSSDASSLRIEIEDNGQDLKDEYIFRMQQALASNSNDIETTGTVNIHRRIRMKFSDGSGLIVGRGALGGLKVVICLVLPGERNV